MNETIGFIGLGALGQPIAHSLLKAGYLLKVYNRTASKAEPLKALGAEIASCPADTLTPGGVVVTVVSNDEALENVVMSEGFLQRLGAGGIHLSMSTVSPAIALYEKRGIPAAKRYRLAITVTAASAAPAMVRWAAMIAGMVTRRPNGKYRALPTLSWNMPGWMPRITAVSSAATFSPM